MSERYEVGDRPRVDNGGGRPAYETREVERGQQIPYRRACQVIFQKPPWNCRVFRTTETFSFVKTTTTREVLEVGEGS